MVRHLVAAAGFTLLVAVLLIALWMRFPSPDDDATAEQVLAAARDAAAGNDWEHVRSLASRVLASEPNHAAARLLLGQAEWNQGQADAALSRWDGIRSGDPDVIRRARYFAGQGLLQLGRAADAEARLVSCLESAPQDLLALELLLDLYTQQRRRDDTRDVLDAIRSRRPLTVVELAGELLAGQPVTSVERGLTLTETWLRNDPGDTESARARMRYLLEAGRPSEVHEVASRLADAGGDAAACAPLRALAALRAGNLDTAVEAVSSIPRGIESSSEAWEAWGRVAAALEDQETAARALRVAARSAPFDIEVHFLLATMLQQTGAADAPQVLARSRELDELEREAFLMLRSGRYAPQLVADTIARMVDRLIRIDEPHLARDWTVAGLRLVPFHSQLRELHAGLPVREPAGRQLERRHDQHRQDALAAIETLISRYETTAPSERPADGLSGVATDASIQLIDIAAEIGIDFQFDNGASRFKRIFETTGGGVAVLDFDADGWPDLFFPQGGPVPPDNGGTVPADRLYRNARGRHFEESAFSARLTDRGYSQGVAVGDYNDDGFPDLLIANVGVNRLYENCGDGTFRQAVIDVLATHDQASSSAAFGDFDGDGLLDIYVVNYISDWTRVCYNSRGEIATCDPHSMQPAQDRIYRNVGDGTFEDITATAGCEVPGGKGLGVLVADFNGDARQDIYVANDGTPNFLFRNAGPGGQTRFEERGLLSGAAVSSEGRAEAGMGIAAADFDGDDALDLFVTNFYQEPNRLYLGDGTGYFRDATRPSGLDRPSRPVLGFGTQPIDVDRDGDFDLFVANGDIDDYSAMGRPWKMRPQLFRNDGCVFTDVSNSAGPYFAGEYIGRGVARFDFNRDANSDLVVVHQDRPVAVLENRTRPAADRSNVRLRLIGRRSNRDALGAQIRWTAGPLHTTVHLNGGDGYMASNERVLSLPLPAGETTGSLTIRWPDGSIRDYGALPCGAWCVVEDAGPIPLPCN